MSGIQNKSMVQMIFIYNININININNMLWLFQSV